MLELFDLGLSPGVAAGLILLLIALFITARRHYLSMPNLLAIPPNSAAPDCMVIIPARNEEMSIISAVQSFPHDTVIVIDDHSEDATAEAARKAGAGVLRSPDLARGAMGKSNACAAGARALTSKWILFTDADTRFEPGFLDAAVAFAEANGISFVSFYLRPVGDSFVSRILLPVAVALYFCGVSPRGNPQAVFNGQCVLVRREAYEFVGGHSAVLTSRVEDVKLAALAERHRLKIATARAPALGSVRYRELSKTMVRSGARFMMIHPAIGLLNLFAALTLASLLPVLAWLWKDGGRIAAEVFLLLPVVLLWSWYRSWRVLFAPVAIYFLLPMIVSGFAAALTGRRIDWKNRTL